MMNGAEAGDIKVIMAELEERAAEHLAAYHRIQGALDTWKEIRRAMLESALVERGEHRKATEVTGG